VVTCGGGLDRRQRQGRFPEDPSQINFSLAGFLSPFFSYPAGGGSCGDRRRRLRPTAAEAAARAIRRLQEFMFTAIPRGQESISTAASAATHLGTLPSFIRLILSFVWFKIHVSSSAWLSYGGQIN
jgi:hypothetical protein